MFSMLFSLLVCLVLNSHLTMCFYAVLLINHVYFKMKSECCYGVFTLGHVQKLNGKGSDHYHLMLELALFSAGDSTT